MNVNFSLVSAADQVVNFDHCYVISFLHVFSAEVPSLS